MEVNKSGVTGVEILQVAFIVMKMCGVMKCPWWMVLLPTWITVFLAVVGIVVYLIMSRSGRD